MNDVLAIHLDAPDGRYRPGQCVSGRIEWALAAPPDALALRLFWYTEGRGDRDVGLAGSLSIAAPAAAGSEPFELALPSGPYSFSGRLISLIWALELVASPGDRSVRREIGMSPTGDEIRLAREAS